MTTFFNFYLSILFLLSACGPRPKDLSIKVSPIGPGTLKLYQVLKPVKSTDPLGLTQADCDADINLDYKVYSASGVLNKKEIDYDSQSFIYDTISNMESVTTNNIQTLTTLWNDNIPTTSITKPDENQQLDASGYFQLSKSCRRFLAVFQSKESSTITEDDLSTNSKTLDVYSTAIFPNIITENLLTNDNDEDNEDRSFDKVSTQLTDLNLKFYPILFNHQTADQDVMCRDFYRTDDRDTNNQIRIGMANPALDDLSKTIEGLYWGYTNYPYHFHTIKIDDETTQQEGKEWLINNQATILTSVPESVLKQGDGITVTFTVGQINGRSKCENLTGSKTIKIRIKSVNGDDQWQTDDKDNTFTKVEDEVNEKGHTIGPLTLLYGTTSTKVKIIDVTWP